MSNEDPLSTTAVAQRAASARVDAAEDSATPPMPPPAKTKRKGRPPKAKGSEALEWSEPMTASLMRLRYETYSSKFLSARNNATSWAVWMLLAGELSKEHEVLISSDQCNNKVMLRSPRQFRLSKVQSTRLRLNASKASWKRDLLPSSISCRPRTTIWPLWSSFFGSNRIKF
ncbi:hypothetical protein PC116_g16458 [Phytophthora cactorum]|nr:hypothetical protein PC116_g16458 [Phytophthora cactorum]